MIAVTIERREESVLPISCDYGNDEAEGGCTERATWMLHAGDDEVPWWACDPHLSGVALFLAVDA